MKKILILLAVLWTAPAFAQVSNTIYPPACGSISVNNSAGCSAFGSSLYTFLAQEDAGRWQEQGFGNFVSTLANANACLGATAAGLTMTPTACVAYNAGFRGTETGAITLPDASTCWISMDYNTSGSNAGLPNSTRVAGTHYLYDCVDVSAPTEPANAQLLMEAVTSGGAITSVTDKRNTNPIGANTIPVSGGGTGLTNLTAHDVLVGAGTSNVHLIAPTTNYFLAGVASADPAFRALLASDVPGIDSVTVTGTPSAGQVIQATSSSAANWANTPARSDLATGAPLATVSNSTSETSMFSYSLPGGTLTTAGVLHCHVEGNYLNNSGGVASYTLKFYYGAAAILTAQSTSINDGTNLAMWSADVNLATTGATNTEWGTMVVVYNTTLYANNTTGAAATPLTSRNAGVSVDSTANQTVKLTVTLGAATSTQTFTSAFGYCQLQ